jgi:hypothetical protein
MSQEAVFKVLGDIAMADSMSYWLVGSLTALVFVVMRAMLPVKGLSLILAPAVFWGGLSGIYTLSMLGIHFTSEKSSNVILSAAIGMIVALIATIFLLRLLEAAFRIRTPLTRTAAPPAMEPRRVRI